MNGRTKAVFMLLGVLFTIMMTATGWMLGDREKAWGKINVDAERLATLEAQYEAISRQLDRIEATIERKENLR